MEKQHVAVVYATDYNHECTVVSMESIVQNRRHDTAIDFYILIDEGFTKEAQQFIQACFEQKEDCTVVFKCVGDIFDHVYLNTDFITRATYFRLLIPDLVPCKRCIYLDSDTIVCVDLQELFHWDMGDNLIAGVKAPGYHLNKDSSRYCSQIHIPLIDQYINAGVLLMDLVKMREINIAQKFMELLPEKMPSQDQDIINSACYGRILQLPLEYNMQVPLEKRCINEYAHLFPNENLYASWNNPKIVHYSTQIKPWKTFECTMGDYWWNVCRKSPVWDYFYHKMEDSFFVQAIYRAKGCGNTLTTKKTFPCFELLYKKKVVLYGAGTRALRLFGYLKWHNFIPEFFLVSNKKGNPEMIEGISVLELNEDIRNRLIDKTVVIATLEKYHGEIIAKLQKYAVNEIIPLNDLWDDRQ